MKTLINLALCASMVIQPVWAQSLNETFNTTTSLTDQEQVKANNYYHQGIAEKYLEEECKKLKTGCNDTSSKPGNVLGGFEEVLPKLYAVMGTLAAAGVGGKIQMKSSSGSSSTTTGTTGSGGDTQAQPEKKEKTDICIYIPMVGEMVSSATQQQAEQQIQQTNVQTGADRQKDALYAVARTHQTRAKTAKMQGAVYAATGACYVSYLAMGAVANPMFIAKLGASVAMSAIFFKKAGKHKEYANKLKEIANNLPGAGECNPYTNTNCFCSEDTSYKTDPGNFNRFCVAKALVNNGPAGTQVACATLSSTGAATVDASCACKKTNSCANVQLGGLAGQIGLGAIGFKDPLSVLDNTTGSFNDGSVGAFGEGLNARNANALKNSAGGIPNVDVNGKTKDIADKIASLGVPANVAGMLANQSDGSLPDSSATAPALASDGTAAQEGSTGRANIPGYNSAPNSRGFVGSNDPGFVNPLAGLNKTKKPSSVQIETFAEKAIREAEITNDTSRGLFEIISNRYRTSGWGQEANNQVP